jgi:hypothetical protein
VSKSPLPEGWGKITGTGKLRSGTGAKAQACHFLWTLTSVFLRESETCYMFLKRFKTFFRAAFIFLLIYYLLKPL